MHQPRRFAARTAASAICLLTIGLVPFAAACSDDDSKPSPTPTSAPIGVDGTPPPAPTNTPAPADPDLGAALRYEGEFEAAIDVYGAIAAEGSGGDRHDALFTQAQLLSREQRFDEARIALEAYLGESGAPDSDAARYMLASTLDDLGDSAGALAQYERYIAAAGVLTRFAGIERAKLLARLGQPAAAEEAAQAVVADPGLLGDFRASFALSMGRAFEQGGADADALRWYARVGEYDGDVASARALSSANRKRLGDPGWIADYRAYIAAYPESASARELLAELDAASAPVSDYVRGVVEYRARQNDAARVTLARAIAAGDNPAEAAYYLAALDEREDGDNTAISRYQQAFQLDPQSPQADDALWWRARLLQHAGRYDEAGATYATLAETLPLSGYAADARFQGGMVLFRDGREDEAATTWGAIAASLSSDGDEEDRLRAQFWQARALIAAGDDDAGKAELETLLAAAPGNFYALRAEVLLGRNDDRNRNPDLNPDNLDWDAIEDYVTATMGVEPENPPRPELDDVRWATGAELERVGLHPQSIAVLTSLIGDYDGNPAPLYRITRRLAQDGYVSLAARAATRLIEAVDTSAGPIPDDLYRIAYPLAFGDLAEDAAADQDVSPLLLLALVRQESFYDPQAGSTAGALGLTQVIEPTGEAIAADLGVEGFVIADLFRPRLSLRFGASYLADQLAGFDDNEYHALAAYNGGPGAADDGIAAAGRDIDLFVEDLEFDETRLYVKLVAENYARYRQLYGGADRPSLPR